MVNNEITIIEGESQIGNAGGRILSIRLQPSNAPAYEESVAAILNADLVVIGPGSLYTSLIPNLMVTGIADALRATAAYRVYICNVATQPGETEGYDVADHILALEEHVGPDVVDAVLANNFYPTLNAGVNTHYVQPAPDDQAAARRYVIRYADLTDVERPWRHDPQKLVNELLHLVKRRDSSAKPVFTTANKPAIMEP
jgi:uncharacterized cofD-like protein